MDRIIFILFYHIKWKTHSRIENFWPFANQPSIPHFFLNAILEETSNAWFKCAKHFQQNYIANKLKWPLTAFNASTILSRKNLITKTFDIFYSILCFYYCCEVLFRSVRVFSFAYYLFCVSRIYALRYKPNRPKVIEFNFEILPDSPNSFRLIT